MAFDAGAIIAHLEVDLRKFDKDLADAERRVDKFSQTHKVRLQADFDSSALPRARKFFSDLDKAATLDAIQRSRSGNGSLLGTLMGLTSGHQIPGMPTGTQAARQGSIGQILKVPVQAVAPDKNSIGQAITAATGGAQARAGAAASGDNAGKSFSEHFKDTLSRAGLGGFIGGLLGSGKGGGILGKLAAGAIGGGRGGQGNLLTGILGGIGPALPGVGLKASGIIAGGGSLLGALPALIGGLAPLLAAAPGLAGIAALAKGSLSGISPLTQLQAQIQSQQAAGLGSTAAGAKQIAAEQKQLAAGLAALNPAQKSLFNSVNQIQNAWQNLTQSFTPLMAKALGSVAKLFNQLLPDLKGFFGASAQLMGPLIGGLGDIAKNLLPLFTAGIKAAIPVIRPLLDGLGSLVSGIFPGLIVLVKQSLPAVLALGQVFGGLGKDIGGLFAALAPGIKASTIILKALFDLLGAIFPIVGKLATIMANALGPVFSAFASVVKSLLPVLTIIGQVLGSLAGAILGDLVAAFTALAMLLKDVSPSLQVLAKALEQAFAVLENAGVFAIFGNVLEATVPLVARLVNVLVGGLAPILPQIIGLISTLATIAVKLLAAGLALLIPVAIQLVNAVMLPLLPIVKSLIPVITVLANLFAAGLTAAVTALLKVLAPVIVFVVQLAAHLLTWLANTHLLLPILILLAALLAPIPTAIAAIGIAIGFLVTHWTTIWGDIKKIAADAWNFIWNGFGKYLLPLLGPVGLIALGAIELYKHWQTIWGDVKSVAGDIWHYIYFVWYGAWANLFGHTIPRLWDDFISFTTNNLWNPLKNGFRDAWSWVVNNVFDPMKNFIINTVPGWWNTAVSNIGTMFGKVKTVVQAPVKFVIDDVLDGLISVFDTITNAVGLGKPISQVHPFGLAAGGKITTGTTPYADDVLARVSKDETVVSAAHSRLLSPIFSALGIRGYAKGGKVGQNAPHPGVIGSAIDVGKIILALATGNATAATNAFVALMGGGVGGAAGEMAKILTAIPKMLVKDAIHWLLGSVGTSGSTIAEFAAQYLGKIPYVWGGTSLFTGADCSGFVQAIYKHFGILAPRTSEAQGAWVKRGPPTPGGLAFYHSPPGGPDPGHVAIVRNINQVISQGGGLGPQLMPLHGMPLLWTGTPPGGFGTQPATRVPGGVANWLMQAMAATGVPGWWLNPLEKIQSLETDSLRNMTTVVNPNGGATGLMQVKPGTFAEFFKFPGAIFNPVSNAIAAIRHIEQAWGSPLAIPGIGAPGTYQGYDSGGWMIGWPNTTGQPEAVLTPAESRAFVAQNTGNAHNLSDVVDRLETLIAVAARSPAATAAGVSKAVGGTSRRAAYSLMYGAR